ncbi:MAG: hypothetical protein WA863_04145, partial [Methyloceanibacter sp.]
KRGYRRSQPGELGSAASIGSAIAEFARSGYPEATSTGLDRASEALGLFISNAVACLDTQR